jgi:SRSO17 transposase
LEIILKILERKKIDEAGDKKAVKTTDYAKRQYICI